MTIDTSRREWMRALALTGLASALPTTLWAAQAKAPTWKGGFSEIAPGIFAAIATPKVGGAVEIFGNAGLVLGGRVPLAIDSTGDAQVAAQFVKAARSAAKDAAIGRLILTSQHNGFVAGLPLVTGAEIVSHENCRAAMKGMGPKFRPVVPDFTVSKGATYLSGANSAHVYAPMDGPAATELVVHVPEAKVLFTGGLAGFGVVPDSRTARFAQWIATIDAFIALNPTHVVPGYGPVGSVVDLKTFKAYLETVMAQGRKAQAAGMTPGKAAATIDLGPFANWHAAEAMKVPTMVRLFHELSGTAKANPDMAGEKQAREEYQALKGTASK